MKQLVISLLLLTLIFSSCKTSIPTLFGKRSPHEQYGQSLIKAGLMETSLGKSWFAEAEKSLNIPLTVTIPYKETGYFPSEKIRATAIKFDVKRGEKLSITLKKKPLDNFNVYVDLWEVKPNDNKKLLSYADTSGNPFTHEIDEDGTYLLRLQPELLSAGEYTLTVLNGPSLAFPVKNGRIGSFWGADRDDGFRRHEGVDIFAPKRTPALAAADGTVSRVTVNKLGGKVVFFKPTGKNYTLYYAHLDEQSVTEGQRMQKGDTLGLVGNTGNAMTTSPHLHFGIYTFGGAINPITFINPVAAKPAPISGSLTNLGKYIRNTRSLNLTETTTAKAKPIQELPSNTLLEVVSATDKYYKVVLPDGTPGFISAAFTTNAEIPLRSINIKVDTPLYDNPNVLAARKTTLKQGDDIAVLANLGQFYFVEFGELRGWVSKSL